MFTVSLHILKYVYVYKTMHTYALQYFVNNLNMAATELFILIIN